MNRKLRFWDWAQPARDSAYFFPFHRSRFTTSISDNGHYGNLAVGKQLKFYTFSSRPSFMRLDRETLLGSTFRQDDFTVDKVSQEE